MSFILLNYVVQSTLSPEAKEVYSSLVEQPLPSSPPLDTNPLRMLRSGAFPVVRPKVRGNKHTSEANNSRSLPRLRVPPPPSTAPPPIPTPTVVKEGAELMEEVGKLSVESSEADDEDNPIPLPPRDRSRPTPPTKPRHQRKHPLIIPGCGVSRTLAKMSEPEQEQPILEEEMPDQAESEEPDRPVK